MTAEQINGFRALATDLSTFKFLAIPSPFLT